MARANRRARDEFEAAEAEKTGWHNGGEMPLRHLTPPGCEPLAEGEAGRLLELTGESIFTIELDGTVRSWSRGAEATYLWPRELAVGRVAQALLVTKYPAARDEIVAAVLREGRWTGELTQCRRGGAPLTLNSLWLLMRDAAGQPQAIMQINTALAKAELATRASEARFRSVLESAPDAIVIVNAMGRIEISNRRVFDLFGYSSDELRGRAVEMLMPDRFAQTHPAYRERFGRHPQAREMGEGLNLVARHKSGTEFPVEISLSPLWVGNEFLVTAVVRDISERQQAAAAQKRLHALELAEAGHLATLGEVAAGLAHEIKNPLAGIAGALEVLAPHFSEAAEEREIMHDILRQVGRIKRAVEDLLHYARPRPLQLVPADLNATVEGVVHFAARALPAGVAVEFTPTPLPPLMHDPDQIQHLVLNLLLNAADAMSGGGQVQVWTDAVKTPSPQARVHVRDQGTGIETADQERIFRPFYTTKGGKGNGLGLPLCRRIAELHSGALTVESQSGEGATFTLSLPMGAAPRR